MSVFNKLVRDKIPEIITSNSQTPITRVLDDAAYQQALHDKLREEVAEYLADKNTEELADILEVVYALAKTHGATPQELEAERAAKADKRGGFADKIYLESAE